MQARGFPNYRFLAESYLLY